MATIERKTIFDPLFIIDEISISSKIPYIKITIKKKTLMLSIMMASFSWLAANFEYKNILTPAKIDIIGNIKNTSRYA